MTAPLGTEIVVADASRLRAEALALALVGRGYLISGTATTAESVLWVVAERRPDVCLVDASLLGGSSLDLIGAIHLGGPGTKVIVTSRGADPRQVADAVEAGAVGYLRKDQGFEALERALRRVASGAVCVEPVPVPENLRRRTDGDRPFRWLTQREREVLRRLTEGDDTVAIAHALGMTTNTARTHIQSVLDKLGVHSRLEAVALVNRHSGGGLPE